MKIHGRALQHSALPVVDTTQTPVQFINNFEPSNRHTIAIKGKDRKDSERFAISSQALVSICAHKDSKNTLICQVLFQDTQCKAPIIAKRHFTLEPRQFSQDLVRVSLDTVQSSRNPPTRALDRNNTEIMICLTFTSQASCNYRLMRAAVAVHLRANAQRQLLPRACDS